ncbi:MAG: AAA-like domain-containing protein [Chloroflexota bacterium]
MNERTTDNPFRPHTPVWQLENFFGRSREAKLVLQSLRNGQCVSIVGPPKRGKTSFLNYIADIDVFQRYALRVGEHIFVRIDVKSVQGLSLADVEQETCFFCLRGEIIQQVKESNITLAQKLEQATEQVRLHTAYFGLTTLFRTAFENGLKPIVVLDNFDSLAMNTRLSENFFTALRAFATSHYMAYLIASQHPIHELEKVRIEASPLFSDFYHIVLAPFSSEESREFVAAILDRVNVQLPVFVIDHILELGCNEPYCLQLAGYHTFEVWREKGKKLLPEDCEEIERRFEAALNKEQKEGMEKRV